MGDLTREVREVIDPSESPLERTSQGGTRVTCEWVAGMWTVHRDKTRATVPNPGTAHLPEWLSDDVLLRLVDAGGTRWALATYRGWPRYFTGTPRGAADHRRSGR